MTLRTRILVYVVVMHVVFAAIAVAVMREHWLWVVVVDALFLISIIVAYRLTRSFLVPLELIRTGAELIRERDFSTRFRPVGQQEMDALVDVYNRMIDQLRSERLRLREQGELFDKIVAASPGGIVICDLDRCISQVNPSSEALLGDSAEELLGRPLAELKTPVGRALATLGTGASRVVSLADGRRLRCRRAEFRDRGFARSFYLLEELTEELRQSEKSAYEKLIRMMSHEVNNSVAAVGSLIAAAGGYGDELGGDHREDFEQALAISAERLEHLRAFMNGFAEVVRLPEPERRGCDVEALLRDLITLMGPYLEERRIRCRLEIAARPPENSLDKNQMEQVFVNLLKNAAEAIGEDGAVTVRLGGEPRRPWVEIEDTGCGIPAAAREQLFTPFFTTKENGCGLGLTVVREILARHGFRISLESPEGHPTRFRVVMPRS